MQFLYNVDKIESVHIRELINFLPSLGETESQSVTKQSQRSCRITRNKITSHHKRDNVINDYELALLLKYQSHLEKVLLCFLSIYLLITGHLSAFKSRICATKHKKHDTKCHRYFKHRAYKPCPPLVRSKGVYFIQQGIKVQLWLIRNIFRHYPPLARNSPLINAITSCYLNMRFVYIPLDCEVSTPYTVSGIILGMGLANERRRYIVTSAFICWAHGQIDHRVCVPIWLI